MESDSIKACICTTDLCTGLGDDQNRNAVSSFSRPTQAPRHERTLSPRIATTQSSRIDQFSSRYTTQPTTSFRRSQQTEPTFERRQPSSDRVKCHQCGRLFSRDGNSACTEFDENDSTQQGYCKVGEACLWYSWQKSRTTTAYVRECFSTSIVLGTVDDPLVAKPYCDPLDISENSISKVTACLCETDLCNAYRSGSEGRQSKVNQQSSRRNSNERDTFRTNTPASRRQKDGHRSSSKNHDRTSKRQQNSGRQATSQRNKEIEETPRSPSAPKRQSGKQVVHPDKAGLQCFSCGSLLNPDAKCESFSRTNISQTQTCLKDESCLMYTWKKSSSETGDYDVKFIEHVLQSLFSYTTRMLSNKSFTRHNNKSFNT